MKTYRFSPRCGLSTDWRSDEIGEHYSERLNELLKLLEVGEKYVNAKGTWERIQ